MPRLATLACIGILTHSFEKSSRKLAAMLTAIAIVVVVSAIQAGAAPANALFIGRVPAGASLSVSIVLPLRNRPQLDSLVHRLYDPGDSLYGRYLTPRQFADSFGPNQADVDAVIAFARNHDLSIGQISENRTVVRLVGTSDRIERAFDVHLNSYADATGRQFHSPDRAPTVSSDIAGRIIGIVGLDNSAKPQRYSQYVPLPEMGGPVDLHYTGLGGGLAPSDTQSIYNLTVTKTTGAGQTLGLFEQDGWTPSDISTFQTQYGIPALTPTLRSVDGGTGAPQDPGGAAETTLDIDMLTSLAPGISGIVVYQTPEPSSFSSYEQQSIDIFNAMADDDKVDIASVSYGISELDHTGQTVTYDGDTVDFMAAENQALEQMVAQGQTVCVAAGDAGAYTDQSNFPNIPNTSDPGSQPWVLSVGGTDLTDTAMEGYAGESSWSDPFDTGRGIVGTGGGGGISAIWAIPSYQLGLSTSVNTQGSTTMRNVPDVSLYGDYDTGGYSIYMAAYGGWAAFNGTSASSPLWASFLAGVNSTRNGAGLPDIGFANPAIYAAAEKPTTYALDFHDINDGSNNLYYTAVAGYDNTTGWGSFNGNNLARTLAAAAAIVPTAIEFSPGTVVSGATTSASVTLSGPAPAGGASVAIAAGGKHRTIVVPAGATGMTFPLVAGAVGIESVTATYHKVTVTGHLQVVQAFGVQSIALNSQYAIANSEVAAVVKMTSAAPNAGATIKLFDDGTQIETVRMQPGETVDSLYIETPATPGSYTITAKYGATSASAPITVIVPPSLKSIVISPNPLYTNRVGTGTITLNANAPEGGASVLVLVHGQKFGIFTIPAGSPLTTFSVGPVPFIGSFVFKAEYYSSAVSTTLTVKKAPAELSYVSLKPATVVGGNITRVKVVLTKPALTGGSVVMLTSSNTAAPITNPTLTIPAGSQSGSFDIKTTTVTSDTSATILASSGGATKHATLTIKPS